MITSLTGNNAFALRHCLNEITKSFIQNYGELAVERFDGEEAEAQAIIDAISNLPFLANKKMVVVRNGSANPDFTEQVEQIISSTPEWCDLVLYEPQIDKRTAYFKVLKSQTKFEEYPELDMRGLAKWLVEEAKNQGGELSFADANYLVEHLGTDQNLLYNELQKLLVYDSQISRANIGLLTEPTPQSKVFELLDATFAGQKRRALRLYNEQRAQRVEPQAILAMISWQLNLIALAMHAGKRSAAEIAGDSGNKEFPIRKALDLAAKIPEPKLKKLVANVFKLDLKSKTTSLDLDEALRTYIVSL